MKYCIKCEKGLVDKSTNYFCSLCGYLNIFDDVNYFEYMGLPLSLIVNLDNLEDKYLQLMVKYHPDKFVNKDEKEQHNALAHSSLLNNAYNTLKEPLLILSHIYKHFLGRDIIKDETTINNPMISMEFLELYEELDEAKTHEEVENFVTKIQNKKNNILNDLNKLNLLEEVHNTEKLIMEYIKLKYIYRILEKSLLKNIG